MTEDTILPGRPSNPFPTYNASNPEHKSIADELAQYRVERMREDLTAVMDSPAGRAVMARVFKQLHPYALSANLDHAELAALHGARMAAMKIKGWLDLLDPTAYHRMQLEADERERTIEAAFKRRMEQMKPSPPPA